jgi:hypothetical protein
MWNPSPTPFAPEGPAKKKRNKYLGMIPGCIISLRNRVNPFFLFVPEVLA